MAQERPGDTGTRAGPDGVAIAEAYIDLAEAWSGFVAHRMRQTVCTTREILGCSDPVRIHNAQVVFIQNAIKDYQIGFVRMNGILQRVNGEILGDGHDDAEPISSVPEPR